MGDCSTFLSLQPNVRLVFFLSIFCVIVSCLVDLLLPTHCCHDARWIIAEHEVVSFLRDRNKLILCVIATNIKLLEFSAGNSPSATCLETHGTQATTHSTPVTSFMTLCSSWLALYFKFSVATHRHRAISMQRAPIARSTSPIILLVIRRAAVVAVWMESVGEPVWNKTHLSTSNKCSNPFRSCSEQQLTTAMFSLLNSVGGFQVGRSSNQK